PFSFFQNQQVILDGNSHVTILPFCYFTSKLACAYQNSAYIWNSFQKCRKTKLHIESLPFGSCY
ncbi:MAG: hypothetical protein ACI81T_002739, partial [Bacteroidia bacterium]